MTAVHHAAYADAVESLRLLVASGAIVDAINDVVIYDFDL